MGSAETVWGNASGMWLYGEAAIPYGKTACVREAIESHGEAAKPYGEPKSHQNQKYGNVDCLRTLRLFGKKCGHRGDMKVYKRRSTY